MKRRITQFLIMPLFFIILTQLLAQESKQKLYRIYIDDQKEIKLLSKQGFDIYHIQPGKYIEVLAYPGNVETLKKQKLEIEFIANSFKELLERELGDGLSEYHDYETTYEELTQVSQVYPQITRLDTIGYSVENRVIGALKISDNPDIDEDEPPILIIGVHHGDEILNIEVLLHFIHFLVDNYSIDFNVTDWVNGMEMWFIPLMNPDGRENLTRYNSHGIDLNRNYSFQFTPGGTHGNEPFSEPETRTIRDFTAAFPPMLSLTYHSSGRYVLYSWTHTEQIAPDDAILRQIGGIVADSLNYTLRQGGDWYFTAGEYCDYMYAMHGTMAFTVETYTSHTPPASVIDPVVNRNLPGFISLLNQVNQSGITGLITDANSDTAIEATIEIFEIDDQGLLFLRKANPRFGRFYRYLSPGKYTVKISAPGFQTQTFPGVVVASDSLTILNAKLKPSALVMLRGFQIDDDSIGNTQGNSDGIFNINESIGISLLLENQNSIEARSVYAILGTSSTFIYILSDSIFIGNLPPYEWVNSFESFLIYIDPACPDGEVVEFTVSIHDSTNTQWSYPFFKDVLAPIIKVNHVSVVDSGGDQNGVLNNGESVDLELKIANVGHQRLNNLNGKLSSDDDYIHILQDTDRLSFLEIKQDTSIIFTVKLNSDAPNIHLIDFKVDLSSAERYAIEHHFQLYNVKGLYDNFEYENTNWMHDSWKITSNDHDDWQWGTPQGKAGDPSYAYSGEKCWGTDLGYDDYAGESWNGYYQNNVYNYLRSPMFNCTGLSHVGLKFQRWLNLLPGDIAKIRVNNSDIWVSPSEGIQESQWTEQLIDISALADNQKTVSITFELFSNSDGWSGGWNIDDVLATGDLVTGVAENSPENIPSMFRLLDNFPNPFNPTTKIVFIIPSNQHVELKIMDILGREVKSLVSDEREAGSYEAIWDGKDENGNTVSSGVYFYHFRTAEHSETKKLLFLK